MLEGVGRAVCLRYSATCQKTCLGSWRGSRNESCREFPALEQEAQCRELLSRLTSKDERTTEFIEDFRQNGTGPSALLTIEKRLRYMQDLVNTLVSRRYEKESIDLRDKEIERQWRHLALVLDRIFFIMYLVIIIISLVIFFPRGQHD